MPGLPTMEAYALPTRGELPVSTMPWRVDADRAVLLIHDMQRYFVRGLPQPLGDTLVERVATLRAWARRSGVPVAYTAQPGSMTPQERGLLADVWGPGMRAEPDDRAVVDRLAPHEDDWVLTKWRYSAFVRSPLLDRMREAHRDQLVVCGVYAHVGVLMTAADAFQHDIQPFVVGDAIADFSLAYHRLALDWAADRCAVVTTTADVVG
ncbi:isochorismatase family protein [Cellulomonas palmilytica]|uniref:isochorismatase family protein n=1 Tax=Cellulomonas palmilytica TaxID=2608402 RepID=UPI001F433DF8|nr:isochorismatase family protein [Cellulomonas palmilytica]UJP40234.1 isochorismatase family protein [Cellulomonas palmilytica]